MGHRAGSPWPDRRTRASSLLSAVEHDRHVMDAVHEATADALDLSRELPARAAAKELLEKHARLESGEIRPEAEVLSKAERDVRLDPARDVEVVRGLSPHRLVAVRRGVEEHHGVAVTDLLAVQLDVFGRVAEEETDRR